MSVVQVAGAERPGRGLVRVPKRLQALDDGGVPTLAVRSGVGPGGDALPNPAACDICSAARVETPRRVPGRAESGAPVRVCVSVSFDKRGFARDDVDSLTVQ